MVSNTGRSIWIDHLGFIIKDDMKGHLIKSKDKGDFRLVDQIMFRKLTRKVREDFSHLVSDTTPSG